MICRKCKADALIHAARYGNLPKKIKCNHEICWCEYPRELRNNWNVSVKDRKSKPKEIWNIKYCPVCGKKL